jgi:hypothetical protein
MPRKAVDAASGLEQLGHAGDSWGDLMTEERPYRAPLTPAERLALEALRDGKAAGAAGIEAVIRQGWASRTGKGISITAAGERALADDEAARTAMRRP